MVSDQFRMKDFDEVGQYDVGLHGCCLVERGFAQIAVDDTVAFPCSEIGVAFVFVAQGVVGECAFEAVEYPPIVGIRRCCVDLFEIECYATRTGVVA